MTFVNPTRHYRDKLSSRSHDDASMTQLMHSFDLTEEPPYVFRCGGLIMVNVGATVTFFTMRERKWTAYFSRPSHTQSRYISTSLCLRSSSSVTEYKRSLLSHDPSVLVKPAEVVYIRTNRFFMWNYIHPLQLSVASRWSVS